MVALTFDDGPDPRGTPQVLDALARAGVRATFFVLGSLAEEHPALLARIAAEGHSVQVHGYGHLRHPESSRDEVERDLDRALDAIGGSPTLWRVPWGFLAPWTQEVAAERGLTVKGWTVDTHDWRGDTAEEMLEAAALRANDVVLMHDGIGPGSRRADAAETARLVGPLVAAARASGLEPALLDAAWPVIPGNPELVPA